MSERRYVSVTALTRYIKRHLESDPKLQDVWMRGELSNVKRHSRGHVYLTLKDKQSRISAVMFARNSSRLPFTPEDGMKVLVRGAVSLYEPFGQYQFYIKEMQQDGMGNLFLAFEQLKKKLREEGLFDEERKKPLPRYPKEIGVITSPTGAAVRDIYTTIKRRFPAARITLLPVLVQGERASQSISRAIDAANRMNLMDVLIIGRGGGSIEELWAFNEEVVARSIAASVLPIISAVGHETDFTIADFVADTRAATPTAAGEIIVPDIRELQTRLTDKEQRLKTALRQLLRQKKDRLTTLQNAYAFKHPRHLIQKNEQNLDYLLERLMIASRQLIQKQQDALHRKEQVLYKHHPDQRIAHLHERNRQLAERCKRNFSFIYQRHASRLDGVMKQLNALSPLNIMSRGYTLTYNDQENLVKSVRDIKVDEDIKVRFKDGETRCLVRDVKEDYDD